MVGADADGGYYVSAFTLVVAGVECAAPVVVPGLLLYLVLRARLRRAWREAHAAKGVSATFFAENLRRFG